MGGNTTTPQPRKRFPEFQETGDWVERKIGEFLLESRKKGSKGNVAKKLTVKLWGKGVFEKDEAVSGSVNTQYYRRSAGQFIYSKLDFLNQAFGIIPESLDGYESTVDLPCFDIKPSLNPTFLLEYVQRESFYKKNGEVADGGRKARRIQPEVFFDMPLVIPHKIEEQEAIADCIMSLDALIAVEVEKLDALKDHKQGLMQQLFPIDGERLPALRFPNFSGAAPWCETTLSSVIDLISGLHLSPDDYSETGALPYFTGPSDFANDVEQVVKWTDKTSNVATNGDILITVKGSGVGELWDLALPEVALGRQLMALRAHDCETQFLFQFLQTRRSEFVAMASGNLIPGLSRSDILGMKFVLPKPDEQKMISDCLSHLDNLISRQELRTSNLRNHKLGLLQQLFPVLDEVQG